MAKDSEFFQSLRSLGKPSGAAVLARQLFPGCEWYTEGVLKLASKGAVETSLPKVVPGPISEKGKTLESLKQYADKKLEETPGGKIAFPGGEVSIKEGVNLGRKIKIDKPVTPPDWAKENIEVVFYGEASKLTKSANADDARAIELLDKMVGAMRLPDESVVKLLSEEKVPESGIEFDTFMSGLLKAKPKFVVGLGAVATNILLGRREKLTRVHGQFFSITIESQSESHVVQLMPLFHPDFLLINPNMKRTAWIDLQKIMLELEISIS